ncbi:MAG: CDGSH iron-sulfur domain-containing protein [Actinobacteria bacterium]|nr:CDGSH iron-sulfur domain-containing protein [Actinomycetota bacterium]
MTRRQKSSKPTAPRGGAEGERTTFEKEEEVWLCQCKQTKNPPFCDGSHRQIG